jgi:hypothetical protein
MLTIAGIDRGFVPGPVVRHRTFDGKHAAVVVGDDEINGWSAVNLFSIVSRGDWSSECDSETGLLTSVPECQAGGRLVARPTVVGSTMSFRLRRKMSGTVSWKCSKGRSFREL